MPGIGVGKWKAKVIHCGYFILRKGVLALGTEGNDYRIKLPYQAFLLQCDGFNILIDNGNNERHHPYGEIDEGGIEYYSTSVQLLESLANEGLSPGDIDMIIYTHFHADHAGNAEHFPQTKSVAQKDELDNLLNPCFKEFDMGLFDQGAIPALENNKNLVLVDGDIDLMEGIKLIKTPGHTRGHQVLAVNTVNGFRIFAGDLFHIPPCAFPQLSELVDDDGVEHKIIPPPANWPFMPSSLTFDFYDYYSSAERIKKMLPGGSPEYLICGHDASLRYRDF